MDTMHYTERKKSSKGAVIFLSLFVLIGGAIIFLAVANEQEPTIIGQNESEVNRLVDLDKVEAEETIAKNKEIEYKVKDKKYEDTSNSKIKSNMTLPVIEIAGENLAEINTKINDKYVAMFDAIKKQLSNADYKYTFSVSYNVYDNIVGTKRIISVVVTAENVDDTADGKIVTKKVDTYNIDLATKKEVALADTAMELLGKDYKTKIKEKTVEHLVLKEMMKEEDYIYALTGLESYYVKDSKFHIVYNEGELVDKKYSTIDIEV